jgi:hypothetical protein
VLCFALSLQLAIFTLKVYRDEDESDIIESTTARENNGQSLAAHWPTHCSSTNQLVVNLSFVSIVVAKSRRSFVSIVVAKSRRSFVSIVVAIRRRRHHVGRV